MTIPILFIQGVGEGVHDQWDDKLVESLRSELGPDYDILYPRMPDEDDPSYAAWKPFLEKELAGLDDGAIVIGHSIGGTILINALADRPLGPGLGAIVLLAAPFIGEGGWTSEDTTPLPDLGARLPAGVPVWLYHGTNDEIAPPEHLDLYAEVIPGARLRRLSGRDHQLNNDLSEVMTDIRQLRTETAPLIP